MINKFILLVLIFGLSLVVKAEKSTIELDCDIQKLSNAQQGSGGHIILTLSITPKEGIGIESETFGSNSSSLSNNIVCVPRNNNIVKKIYNIKSVPVVSKGTSSTYKDKDSVKAAPSMNLQKFLPLVQLCDMKKTTYEKGECKKNIPLGKKYIVEGTIFNIIDEKKFIVKLESGQYANIFGNFSQSMNTLIKLSNNKQNFSFIGELTDLGTGIMVKHDFNYIKELN